VRDRPWTWAAFLVPLLAIAFWMLRARRAAPDTVLPPLTAPERDLRGRLHAHVERLAAGGASRCLAEPAALERAALYVEEQLGAAGDAVARQPFTVHGREVRNLEVERRGAGRPQEIVVLGAHYDAVAGAPGADDNASGVAALLEIARLLAGRTHPRTLRLVAFVNEEPPFFQTGDMGSLRYARRCRERGENVVAMLALESIGFYSDRPGSQDYPAGLGLLYPSTGNFLGVVGDLGARGLVDTVSAALRRHAAVPTVAAALPGLLPGVGWSDHWSFGQAGYRAVMLTDTAPFRNPHYHQPTDTPDTLDYDRTARVTAAVAEVVAELLAAP
jgi:Peptidase family M28